MGRNVARVEETRNAYRYLVGKLEGPSAFTNTTAWTNGDGKLSYINLLV
jgi:hypothetical protein